MKIKTEKETVKALNLYVKELEKLAEKYQKKRQREVDKTQAKFGEIEFTREGLAEAYGYSSITRREYEEALDKVEQSEDAVQVAADLRTSTSEMLRMLRRDICDLKIEIADIGKEATKP